jgi:hypothetical protein
MIGNLSVKLNHYEHKHNLVTYDVQDFLKSTLEFKTVTYTFSKYINDVKL